MLEYTSRNDWVDTVIAADSKESPYGTISNVGSYTGVDGDKRTQYVASVDDTISGTVDPSVNNMPHGFLINSPIRWLVENDKATAELVEERVLVCYRDACNEPSEVLRVQDLSSLVDGLYTNDRWTIPLGDGGLVRVLELRIMADKES